jgi:GTP cyclohydrolase II
VETVETNIVTQHGPFRIVCVAADTYSPDFALVRGDVAGRRDVLVRVQSECITGHVLKSLSCDCYEQLQDSLAAIAEAGLGVLIYLRQEGRGIGLADKIRSYVLQKQGEDTVDANLRLGRGVDERTYETAGALLRVLGVESIVLLTNNPGKTRALQDDGIAVAGTRGVPPVVREQNVRYLRTKVSRMGHTFSVPR